MDTSFDLVKLLRQQPTTKSHKIRPTQFVSVAGGVQKRLETNIKNRKSSRSSVFDRIRNITKCESPKAPTLSDAQQKALHRKQQLEKWKEEKDKKKKEAAAHKKKPFVAGISQRKTFGPPPPPPKPLPSTSGRVTRSQARQKPQPTASNTQTKSFAPSNATFKPSLFLNTEVPTLAPINKKKASRTKPSITFEPVLPKNLQTVETKTTRSTRAKPIAKPVEIKTKKPNETAKVKAKTTIQKPPPLKQHMFQSSSSSSDMEQPNKLRKKPSLRKPASKPQESASENSEHSDTYVLQHTASSQDTVSMSSQDECDSKHITSMLQDSASASSQDELSTPRNKVPKSESSSEEKLRSPKATEQLTPDTVEEVKNISPCVTMSRGKDNARKEMKKKLDEGLLDEDSSNMERLESVIHFRRQLATEIARLTAMCDTWDQVFSQTVLPEPVQELILTAVGQARLLMSQKLQQFAGLVERCAKPTPGTALVTPADLLGFWDMVFIQVENVDMRFKYLEELRLRNWVEEQKPEAKKVVVKPAAKKVVKPSGGPSRLREMIAAARAAKKVTESQSSASDSDKSGPPASPETRTFEAGFFRISSPVKRAPAPATPANKTSLLKSVLSSEAKKSVSKNSTSFAMLRASSMSKNVDIEGIAPLVQTPTITPVNLYATPARSILKQNNPVSNRKDKLNKTVLFHESEPSSPISYTSCDKDGEPLLEPPSDDKENEEMPSEKRSTRKARLSRQNAEEQPSPKMTRSRRKSAQTPLFEAEPRNRRSARKNKEVNEAQEAEPHNRRSARKNKEVKEAQEAEPHNRRSARNNQEVKEVQQTETPKRATRRRKSAAAV